MSSKNPAPQATEESGDNRSILTDLRAGGEQSVMPDLGGVNPSAPKSKFKVHSQTLVIALVLAASGASLYTMRKQGMGSGIDFKNVKVDYDVDKKGPATNDAQQQRVLAELARSQNPPQVAMEKIQKNPFQLDPQTGVPQALPAIDPAALGRALREKEIEERQTAIRNAVTSVEVINGKMTREGDIIAEVLKVKTIHDRSVDLEADGKVYTVNMSENAQGKGRPMPRK
jgi:hypothetical protein